MSARTVWTCDGCDNEIVVTETKTYDWRQVTVTLDGFNGYPIHQGGDGEQKFHLCAQCRRALYEKANPKFWPRAALSETEEERG